MESGGIVITFSWQWALGPLPHTVMVHSQLAALGYTEASVTPLRKYKENLPKLEFICPALFFAFLKEFCFCNNLEYHKNKIEVCHVVMLLYFCRWQAVLFRISAKQEAMPLSLQGFVPEEL